MEVLFFPSSYQLISQLLVTDTVVAVEGRLSRGKDTPELHGQKMTAPDVRDVGSVPLAISMPSTRCTPPVVEQLREVLRTHPGTSEVRLNLMTRGSTKVLKLDDRLRVTQSPALIADLKQLLGPGCVQ